MQFQTLRIDTDGPVGRIVLTRPERMNALDAVALAELADAAEILDGHDEVRAVVVTGEGRSFCAGFDVSTWPDEPDRAEASRLGDLGAAMSEAITRMRAVTVAALHGWVVGGGVVLALACDLRVAADGTRFSIPEVDLGIPLAWFGVPLLVREVGPAVAKELVITCRPFDASEALRLGMLNRVVPPDVLLQTVEELAQVVAGKPRVAVEVTKRHVNRATFTDHDPGSDGLVAALSDPEALAAARRYLQRMRSSPS